MGKLQWRMLVLGSAIWYHIAMSDLMVYWDDPGLDAKAREFFLDNYNDLRSKLLHAKRTEQESDEPPTKAEAKGGSSFMLGLDNLPRKILPESSFRYLMKTRNDIIRLTTAVPYPTNDGAAAGTFMIRRTLLCTANRFALVTAMLAMLDDRYRTTMKHLRCNVTGFFAVNEWSEETLRVLKQMPGSIRLALMLTPGQTFDSAFGDAFAILQMLSRIYFNVIQAAFGLPEVNACAMAFDGVLLSLTDMTAIESAINAYRDSCREMHAAIVTFVKNGYQTDVQKLAAEMAKSNILLQGKMDLLLAHEEETNSGGKKKKTHYRCSHKDAARFFGEKVGKIERWRRYDRTRGKKGTRSPVEFPCGYDVSMEEMKRAGEKYRGLTAT